MQFLRILQELCYLSWQDFSRFVSKCSSNKDFLSWDVYIKRIASAYILINAGAILLLIFQLNVSNRSIFLAWKTPQALNAPFKPHRQNQRFYETLQMSALYS